MRKGNKEILVVGDRVLVKLEQPDDRTNVGLYLPQTVVEKEKVAGGRVVAKGPGSPLPAMDDEDDEIWKEDRRGPKYIPMQAEIGDIALFLKKASVEIKFEGEEYHVVPQGAILVLIREGLAAEWPEGV